MGDSETIYPKRLALGVEAHHVHGEPISASEALQRTFEPFAVGNRWGAMWDTTWFRCSSDVPAEWDGEDVVALIHLGGDQMVGFTAEGLIHDRDGRPLQGVHHDHREVRVDALVHDGRVEFYVEAAANPIPPWHLPDWPDLRPDYAGEPMYTLEQAELAVVDRSAQAAALNDSIDRDLDRNKRPESPAAGVTAVGHAHIDSAWLWPVRETKRKCARTFLNQLRLMERYPEHRFTCSQAAQYAWIKETHPDVFEQIRRRVAEGRWEPVGGMWVEPDSNVPSGESLLRQLVYGKRFFADEFGVETSELWIPDVFGYSAALPQIAVHCGVTAFITQKMSWNDTNRFPHTTFWWEGHDGSRLLAHFPPANTYNGEMHVSELNAGSGAQRLYPFGYGDGGGGPTREMLERARVLEVEIGSAGGFIETLAKESADLPVWVGELYLEFHRATLTTHADVKLANRRCEEALRAAEMWATAAGMDVQAELDDAWKILLFNQFHDILPGSSIAWVYDDAAREHSEVLAVADRIAGEARERLAGTNPTVFNASSHGRTEVVELPDGDIAVVSAPACGWARLRTLASSGSLTAGFLSLENDLLRVTWDSEGRLTSIWDREAEREVIPAGKLGNVFQLHEDQPKSFDAWEIERVYLDSVVDIAGIESVDIVEDDPLRAGVRFVRRFGGSRIEQVMRLAAGSKRLEFHTRVDWQERHRLLKVAFPVDVRSARATYEIQHGWIERSTVENTSWDLARFEVCGQRWADLSETGYGVALLNDCKYGYDIRSNVMRLSLLRGPGYPDPNADRGLHQFAYALLPHAGDSLVGVVREAETFNLPLVVTAGGQGTGDEGSVIKVDRPGVSVEAVKRALDGRGVVVRICEVLGSRGPATVTLNLPFDSVLRGDGLERVIEPLGHAGQSVSLSLRPFELVTLLFRDSGSSA